MTSSEFITRANYGQRLTAGVHWSPEAFSRMDRWERRATMRSSGYWHLCAPSGARVSYPNGLPEHGPVICGLGAYAA